MPEINKADAEKRMRGLEKLLEYHNKLYYDEDKPEITDREYDELSLELRGLEHDFPELASDASPTVHVGGHARREAGVLVRHRVPMLSIQDVFTREEVTAFVDDMREKLGDHTEFVVETKIDGLSLALRYENGVLVTAMTRGDGREYGEDVTANARVISDIRTELDDKPEYLELRGEVYMENAAFEAVNERQELLGKKPFANPRNCAAGTLRQLDTAVTRERGLSMFVFNLQDVRGLSFRQHTDVYDFLKKNGVRTIEKYFVCRTADEVLEAIDRIGAMRGELSYDIDGAVVKINDLEDRKKCPDTAKNGGFLIAYKYPPEEKETVIRSIELSVGRTGRVTPTAVFDDIRLCGTNVSRATLHNQDYIDSLDVGIGDTVLVYKSGEIIPKIKSVVKEKRPAGTVRFRIPDVCPVCGAPVVRDADTADMRCTGSSCPAQLERRIINFVGRSAMDIKGFGEVYVAELIKHGYIADISDIFRLAERRDDLIRDGIVGREKNTDKLLAAISDARSNEAFRLLTGFGIPNVGRAAARTLMRRYGSIQALSQATREELTGVRDIGAVTAESLAAFFSDEDNKRLISRLESYGVNTGSAGDAAAEDAAGGLLEGRTFVITGTLPGMDRKAAAELIENNGGRVSGSVSRKTDYLLAGENAGSKLARAQQLGVAVIGETQLRELLKKEQ